MLGDTPMMRETIARLADTGTWVLDVEVLRLRPDSRHDDALRILDAGRPRAAAPGATGAPQPHQAHPAGAQPGQPPDRNPLANAAIVIFHVPNLIISGSGRLMPTNLRALAQDTNDLGRGLLEAPTCAALRVQVPRSGRQLQQLSGLPTVSIRCRCVSSRGRGQNGRNRSIGMSR